MGQVKLKLVNAELTRSFKFTARTTAVEESALVQMRNFTGSLDKENFIGRSRLLHQKLFKIVLNGHIRLFFFSCSSLLGFHFFLY